MVDLFSGIFKLLFLILDLYVLITIDGTGEKHFGDDKEKIQKKKPLSVFVTERAKEKDFYTKYDGGTYIHTYKPRKEIDR